MMHSHACPTCEATLRDRGGRWITSLLLAIVGAGVLGFIAGRVA